MNEELAHYKDQLQELKAKTNLEAKFIKKECQVCEFMETHWRLLMAYSCKCDFSSSHLRLI